MRNRLRELLDRAPGEPGRGVAVKLGHPSIVEIAALAGFDYVFFDMEHTSLGLESLETLLLTARAADLGALVRPPGVHSELLARVLDVGADGVLVPGIESCAEVELAIAHLRYPPLGGRGVAEGGRGTAYGTAGPSAQPHFAERANATQVVGVMIETAGAVAEIESIVEVAGLDFVFIGPEDLAASMGHIGQRNHPEVARAVERVIAVATQASMRFAMGVGHPAAPISAERLVAEGISLTLHGSDVGVLMSGMRRLQDTASWAT
jgi:4-hydroxy-2-oxoheptanedioate aldolase